jgi:DNA-binding transcriptional ArsR family regulator
MDVDELLRALAHPARRELLRLCRAGPQPAGALTEALGLAAASTSEHLKVLRKTGLLGLEKQGTFRLYRTDTAVLAQIAGWLQGFAEGDA